MAASKRWRKVRRIRLKRSSTILPPARALATSITSKSLIWIPAGRTHPFALNTEDRQYREHCSLSLWERVRVRARLVGIATGPSRAARVGTCDRITESSRVSDPLATARGSDAELKPQLSGKRNKA